MAHIRADRDAFHFGNVTAHNFVINSGERNNDVRQDVFCPSFYVPPNPREILLDFRLPRDDKESATPEAKVLREILREVVSKGRTRIVSIYGKAGVGKSCILRAFGDEDIQEKFKLREHFPGGIYFVSLGMDATESTLIQGLAEITRMCGAEKLGKDLRGEENMRIVLKKVKEWMKGKKCLVLLDDSWERNGLGAGKVRDVGEIFGDESVLVMTTRFTSLAALGIAIEIEERETTSKEAEAILLGHAKIGREEIEDEEEVEAFYKALKMCGGLPLFLSVVGRGVAHLSRGLKTEGSERKSMWVQYWEKLQALGQDALLYTENDEYLDLSKTLLLSLKLLSDRRGSAPGSLSLSKLSFQEMHRALCVFKKQERIPISVCRRLWKVKSDGAALQIGEWFAGVGLVDIESRRLDGKRVVYIRMHDLVHMFAVECAENEEGVALWHRQLLEGYIPKGRENEIVRKWWSVCEDPEGDAYLFENVCRHLVNSGNVEEAGGLLVSGEWSNFRLEVGGLSAWKGDFWERLEGGMKHGGSASEKEIEKGLEMVRDAVINSWGVVHANPRELGYQVVGRLIDCENEVVRRYLRSIEEVQCKPWLKPMQRFWERSGMGMMIGEFHLGSAVFDIALHKKSLTAVVGVESEVAILDLKEMRVTARCAGHTGDIEKVCIGRDGKWVVSFSDDGTLNAWDIETGEEIDEEEVWADEGGDESGDEGGDESGDESNNESNEDDETTCCACSQDSSFMIIGSKKGKIALVDLRRGKLVGRIRDAPGRVDCIALDPNGQIAAAGLRTGSVVLCDVQRSRSACVELKGRADEVLCVTFSADGRFVASCAEDGAIRLWDVASKTQLGDPFAQLEEERGYTMSVAFTEDSKQIMSANMNGSISVWDAASRAEIRSWQAHAFLATCVAVAGDLDSGLAVSGDTGGTVRVWDLQVTPNEENARIYHEGPVSCIAASPDGSFFVSGSADETLRVWDGGDGRQLGEALCGHEDPVTSVAVSPDSRWVVSVSSDGEMRVWDIGRRAQIGDALRAHDDAIRAVAYCRNNGFIVSGSEDKTVRVWRVIDDCENGGGSDKPSSALAKVTALGGDEGLSSRHALCLEKTLQHDVQVTSLAVSRGGETVFSGLYNGEIWVWDIKSGTRTRRKRSHSNNAIARIDISETNSVVATNDWNQEFVWRLNSSLSDLHTSEEGTGVAKAENREGSVAHQLNEVVCKSRTVHLKSNGQKIATLPESVWFSASAYNAQRRLLCVGQMDGRVLFFRFEC